MKKRKLKVFVQAFSNTKKTDKKARYTIAVDNDVSPLAEGSTFRLSQCGGHLLSIVRDSNGKRPKSPNIASFLYPGYQAQIGRKSCAEHDFTKKSRKYVRVGQAGRIASKLIFK